MIPKIIHYCWFGGAPLPELALKCIESWKKYCPNYEIKRWDETNFNLNYNDYVREAYDAKKWAFVTDVVRLYVLVNYGGIYMDTDVEIIKPLDEILKFEAVSGFEDKKNIPTGLMACQKGQKLFTEFLHEYDNIHFMGSDGAYDTTTNVVRITNICRKYGFVPNNKLQSIQNFTIFPKDYFCPKDYKTGEVNITKNTIAIHHFEGSWLTDTQKKVIQDSQKFRRIFGYKLGKNIVEYKMAAETNGLKGIIKLTSEKISRKNKVKL